MKNNKERAKEIGLDRLACPFCHTPINLRGAPDSGADKPCQHSTIKNNMLVFGEGYSEYIVEVHKANLNDEAICKHRLYFDGHYVTWCLNLFERYSGKNLREIAVLSYGCGIGFDVMHFIDQGCDAYGLETADLTEIWSSYPYFLRNKQHYIVSSFGEIPFYNKTFDLIVSMNVLEHVGTIPPKELVTNETSNIRLNYIKNAVSKLKPGGIFIIAAPNKSYPFDYGHSHHYMPFSAKMMKKYGYSLANPYSKHNFLPSFDDIEDICKKIDKEYPISLAFVKDKSLFGERPAPERKLNLRYGFFRISYVIKKRMMQTALKKFMLPHIHAIIKRSDY